jgi:hypothetical protein
MNAGNRHMRKHSVHLRPAHLKEDGCCRNPLGVGLVAVTQVAPVWQVQAHDAVMGVQQCGVHLEVSRGSRKRLDVYAPLLWVQAEGFERTLLHTTRGQSVDEGSH